MAVGYDIPMLFSDKYISGLGQILNTSEDKVKSVYGSVRVGILGQARYSEKIPKLEIHELKDYVSKIHDMNIRFHYTLNSPWTDLKERSGYYKTKIINNIAKFIDLGIDAFIIANPYLISLIQENFPTVDIIASINFQTTSAYKFISLLNLGCSSVVLDRPVNRNIAFLKKLKNYGEKYSLLVNSTCLFDCSLQQYHANENGYFSSEHTNDIDDKEYCLNYCLSLIKKNPENILKSTWIRPEDIIRYEEIGVKNFKIQGRTLEPKVLLNLIQSYLERKTPNDSLFFIFPEFAYKYPELDRIFKNSEIDKSNFIEYFFMNQANCITDCLVCNYCLKTLNQFPIKEINNLTI